MRMMTDMDIVPHAHLGKELDVLVGASDSRARHEMGRTLLDLPALPDDPPRAGGVEP